MLRAKALCTLLQSSVTIHAIFSGQKTSHSKTCDRMGAPYGMKEEPREETSVFTPPFCWPRFLSISNLPERQTQADGTFFGKNVIHDVR